jgi:CheY-like chemotaxis protein
MMHAPRSHIVLLAEDNEAARRIVTALLESAGHVVDHVSNGHDAIAAVQARRYDLVLMDVQLPALDGFETARHIRALHHASSRLPIVAITATKSTRESCIAAGMNDVIWKPCARAELFAVLDRWIVPPNASEDRSLGSLAADQDVACKS